MTTIAIMERFTRHITEQLIEKLPSDREFYSPEDLQVLEIPEFITERVVIEMDQNLSESLATPTTEWASMDAAAVQFAWKNFIEAIKAEVKMPSSYAKSLFETAVADTLELATRPRQAIPESLFGVDKSLSIDVVKKRIKYITVGRKLAAAFVRYMEKKGKSEVTLDECIEIVAKVDEKLIAGYNSLDWAKETEALFQMAGPKVDPELFRIYFEDKNILKYAKKFDKLTENINRTQFIEVLSSPDIEETDDQPAVKKDEKVQKAKTEPQPSKKPTVSPEKKKSDSKDIYLPEDSILNSFQKRRFGSWTEEEEEPEEKEVKPVKSSTDDEKPLVERFTFDKEEADKSTEPADSSDNHSSIYEELNLKKGSDDEYAEDEEESFRSQFDPELIKKWKNIGGSDSVEKEDDEFVLSETEPPEDDDEGVTSIELYNETDDEEDVPMWRAFLEREDISKLKEEEDESEDQEKPVVDNSKKKEPVIKKAGDIDKWIGKEKKRFIKEIFDGSEVVYQDALSKTLEFEDWKGASKYIQKEVFTQNRIDVFDEVAVDFTDRLHTFFLEYKS
jgi:hypothetical protein